MTKRLIIWCAAVAALGALPASVCLAQGGGDAATFTVRVKPPEQAGNAAVDASLTVRGRRLTQAVPIEGALPQDPALRQDVETVRRLIKANADGNIEAIAALWTPAEQASIRQMAADAEATGRNASYYKKMTRSEYLAHVFFGDLKLLFVRHSGDGLAAHVRVYPFVVRDRKLELTNMLSSDPFYAYLSNVLAKSL